MPANQLKAEWVRRAVEMAKERRGEVGAPTPDFMAWQIDVIESRAGCPAGNLGDLYAFHDDYCDAIQGYEQVNPLYAKRYGAIIIEAMDGILEKVGLPTQTPQSPSGRAPR